MNSGYVDTDMLPGSYPHRKYMVCMVWNIMRGGVTNAGRTTERTNSEDRATQPMEAGGWVSQNGEECEPVCHGFKQHGTGSKLSMQEQRMLNFDSTGSSLTIWPYMNTVYSTPAPPSNFHSEGHVRAKCTLHTNNTMHFPGSSDSNTIVEILQWCRGI